MAPPAAATPPPATPVHRLVIGDDLAAVMKQIERMHCPDGGMVNAKSILYIAKDILEECNNVPSHEGSQGGEGDNTSLSQEQKFEVKKLSAQLAHKSLGEARDDVHSKTTNIFNMLSTYSWDVKVAMILAAYVSSYGEYWLLAQTYREKDPKAMNMVALLQLSELLDDDGSKLQSNFQPLHNLVNSILDLCSLIVEVKDLFSSAFASSNAGAIPMFRATVIISSYWIIRSVVISTSYMQNSLFAKDDPRTASMDGELGNLDGKIQALHNYLHKNYFICYQKLDDEHKIEMVEHALGTDHVDNTSTLKLLFDARDNNPAPVFDISNKIAVSLGTLKNKIVLLLISSTDISQEELPFLQNFYEKCDTTQRSQYMIISFPITESSPKWAESMKSKTLTMPFYIVNDMKSIDPMIIRFVKEKLNFQQESILVALDTRGRISHPNAMPMIWTWGAKAFPLTTKNEESLWESETWSFELLINHLDHKLVEMAQKGKSICLFGGDDLEWIDKFTSKLEEVASSVSMSLEMFFVGKCTDNLPKLEKIIPEIYSEMLKKETPLHDGASIRSFWARLENMLLSRTQYVKSRTKKNNTTSAVDEDDEVLQGLEKLLDKSARRGWALFSKGNKIVLIGDEIVTTKALNEFDKWKANVSSSSFEGAFKDYYEMLQGGPSNRPCCRLHFRGGRSDEILESIKCPECHQSFEKYTGFLCNHQ